MRQADLHYAQTLCGWVEVCMRKRCRSRPDAGQLSAGPQDRKKGATHIAVYTLGPLPLPTTRTASPSASSPTRASPRSRRRCRGACSTLRLQPTWRSHFTSSAPPPTCGNGWRGWKPIARNVVLQDLCALGLEGWRPSCVSLMRLQPLKDFCSGCRELRKGRTS